MTHINIEISEDTHSMLKVYAAQEGTTLKAKVNEVLKEHVKSVERAKTIIGGKKG